MSESKKQTEASIAALAIAGLRFLTPLLVSVLVYIAMQANMTLGKLVETVKDIQITMAKEQAVNEFERNSAAKMIQDHEGRIRKLEDAK